MPSMGIGYLRLTTVEQLEESKAGHLRQAIEDDEETEEYTHTEIDMLSTIIAQKRALAFES